MRLRLDQLKSKLQPSDVFICCASFESRCLSIPESIRSMYFRRVLICVNENFPRVLRSSGRKLKEIWGESGQIVTLNTDNPLRTADSLYLAVGDAVRSGYRRFLIDITTFTHESLLILLRILSLFSVPELEIVYANAADYSIGDVGASKWLSKGIGEVRSVLGYPGRSNPSNRLHLIVMAGFESARAERLIQEYEPSGISLGLGDPDDSISSQHFGANQIFHSKLLEKYAKVLQFTFSCTDSFAARDALKRHVTQIIGHNILIAPMNTKISTVGAGLMAIENDSIQLCYATAHKYNERHYSTPGLDCYYFPLTHKSKWSA